MKSFISYMAANQFVDFVFLWKKDGDTKVYGSDFGSSVKFLSGVSNQLSYVQELLDAEEVIYQPMAHLQLESLDFEELDKFNNVLRHHTNEEKWLLAD